MTTPATPAEMKLELTDVVDALADMRVYIAGHDQADAARNGELRPRQSALRTKVERAQKVTERMLLWLDQAAGNLGQTDTPGPFRDQGPI
jgi:hypothetical protein